MNEEVSDCPPLALSDANYRLLAGQAQAGHVGLPAQHLPPGDARADAPCTCRVPAALAPTVHSPTPRHGWAVGCRGPRIHSTICCCAATANSSCSCSAEQCWQHLWRWPDGGGSSGSAAGARHAAAYAVYAAPGSIQARASRLGHDAEGWAHQARVRCLALGGKHVVVAYCLCTFGSRKRRPSVDSAPDLDMGAPNDLLDPLDKLIMSPMGSELYVLRVRVLGGGTVYLTRSVLAPQLCPHWQV